MGEGQLLPGEGASPVRASLADPYRKHLSNHILPLFGDRHFVDVTPGRRGGPSASVPAA
jgi:hypothetical protein